MTQWDWTLEALGIDCQSHYADGSLAMLLSRMADTKTSAIRNLLFDVLTEDEKRIVRECDLAGELTPEAERWLALTELAGVRRRFR